jgi:hypothetical protein
MKKSMTVLLGTLMVAGVLAGASTTSMNTKKGNTIQPVLHGGNGLPLCPACVGNGGSGSGTTSK